MDGRSVSDRVQPAGGGQRGHLVISEGEHVRAALQIAQKNVLAVGLALGLVSDLEAGLAGVMGLERSEELLEQRLILLRAPHCQRNGLICRRTVLGELLLRSAGGQQG